MKHQKLGKQARWIFLNNPSANKSAMYSLTFCLSVFKTWVHPDTAWPQKESTYPNRNPCDTRWKQCDFRGNLYDPKRKLSWNIFYPRWNQCDIRESQNLTFFERTRVPEQCPCDPLTPDKTNVTPEGTHMTPEVTHMTPEGPTWAQREAVWSQMDVI